ncbi:PqqD family protein [uncultured Mucilaginibacter sp.]|uniref:PqqD family protein n=1 Tax=uncultured Mucilaginibacter sp. TaxID=797541 RepID=UPI0025D748CE|nr:PqqD family protein [uncultured Mucilaginibacter sp.]
MTSNIQTKPYMAIEGENSANNNEPKPISDQLLNDIRDGKAPEEIVQAILDKYDRDPTQFEQDWDGLMTQLKNANLLDND